MDRVVNNVLMDSDNPYKFIDL